MGERKIHSSRTPERMMVVRGLALCAILLFVVSESAEPASMEADALDEDRFGLGEAMGGPEKKSDQAKDTGIPKPKKQTVAEKKKEQLEAQMEEKPKLAKEPPSMAKVIAKIATFSKPGPLVPQSDNEYAKIPHFQFKGTPEIVKTRRDCQKKCGEHGSCRSYSWNKAKRQCYWSTGSVRYGSFWNFYSKEFVYNAFGQWEPTKEFLRFKGMFAIDDDVNMKTVEDRSTEDCKEMCNLDTKCMSFSYHEGSHACLFGQQRVQYKRGWDYYERNKAPKEIGGQYTFYPQKIDSYHAELRKREKASLGIFAERDGKIRKKKLKKEKLLKVQNKETIARKKRLDKEMKQKEFANEQQRKQEVLTKKQHKIDLAAALSRGKFDEAFHKQGAINKELLKKKGMEGAVKGSTIARIHEKDRKERRKLDIRLAKLKDRSMKRLAAQMKETGSKSELRKSEKQMAAIDMKKQAFELVNKEREIKGGNKFQTTKKKNLVSMKTLKGRTYVAEDDFQKADEKEKNLKRAITGEKKMHEVHRKLNLEKKEKSDKAKELQDKAIAKVRARGAAPEKKPAATKADVKMAKKP